MGFLPAALHSSPHPTTSHQNLTLPKSQKPSDTGVWESQPTRQRWAPLPQRAEEGMGNDLRTQWDQFPWPFSWLLKVKEKDISDLTSLAYWITGVVRFWRLQQRDSTWPLPAASPVSLSIALLAKALSGGPRAGSSRGPVAFLWIFLTFFQYFLIGTQELLFSISWAVMRKNGCRVSKQTGCLCHRCFQSSEIEREKRKKKVTWLSGEFYFLSSQGST